MGGFERTRDVPARNLGAPKTLGNASGPSTHATLLDGEPGAPEAGKVRNAAMARQMGFTGDACNVCGSMRMQIAGHCTVCSDCGTTTGCS